MITLKINWKKKKNQKIFKKKILPTKHSKMDKKNRVEINRVIHKLNNPYLIFKNVLFFVLFV